MGLFSLMGLGDALIRFVTPLPATAIVCHSRRKMFEFTTAFLPIHLPKEVLFEMQYHLLNDESLYCFLC